MVHTPTATDLATHWALDPDILFLNHGSFGACPRAVLAHQSELRSKLEAEPVRFFLRELGPLLDSSRERLAEFIRADPGGLAFVANATTGVNSVLRSLELRSGDELLTTDHAYGACKNALDHVAARAGARVRVARIPFPLRDPEQVVAAIMEHVSERTRLAMIDHVTSATGLVLPLERIVAELHARGVDVLVDGAHAPGMVPLDLQSLGVAWYTGNCHKWLCAPKGAGFLWAREDRRESTRPAVISHGATSSTDERSRFLNEFDWVGTIDPTPWLSVGFAIEAMGAMLPGGWPEVMETNRALVLRGREILCEVLGIAEPAPRQMIGSLATVPIPDGEPARPRPLYSDPQQDRILSEFGIEVPIGCWPVAPQRFLRISAQLYNTEDQYTRLAEVVRRVILEHE